MKVAILGGGAMGRTLAQMVEERDGFTLAGMVDPLAGETLEALENTRAAAELGLRIDSPNVVIDFSNPANLDMLCEYCKQHSCPAVIATTGFDGDQVSQIEALAASVPVVFSANFSLGVNVMKRVISQLSPILGENFDIEIVEKHHNKKLDAPSGTAKLLLAAADPEGAYDHVFGREGDRRRGREIGIHAVRGGTIAGEHTVIYAGNDEVIEIRHSAASKKVFAEGALKAAAFVAEAETGLYTMEDVLFG